MYPIGGILGDVTMHRILVIDDDKAMAMCIADMLHLFGHTVRVAFGPRSAIHTLNQWRPDIVFLDVNMPGIDGLEVCRYLRRDPATAALPIIIVSANESLAHKKAAWLAGANAYIVKPVMMEELEQALTHVMTPVTFP